MRLSSWSCEVATVQCCHLAFATLLTLLMHAATHSQSSCPPTPPHVLARRAGPQLLVELPFLSLQAVGIYEDALTAVPTPRMFSLYAAYLEDMLTHDDQTQQAQLSERQQDLLQQFLQLCKRAFQAGQYTVPPSSLV